MTCKLVENKEVAKLSTSLVFLLPENDSDTGHVFSSTSSGMGLTHIGWGAPSASILTNQVKAWCFLLTSFVKDGFTISSDLLFLTLFRTQAGKRSMFLF